MLTDPLALRGAAAALTATSMEVRRLCAELSVCQAEVRWSAPAADVIRRGLAGAGAAALTGAWSLDAGATHLRSVATALEDVREVSRRLYDRAVADLQAQLDGAPSPLAAAAARQALERLDGPDDPSWAAAAGARPVALPVTGAVPEPAVPSSPTGLVDADLAGVRRLADRSRTTGATVAAACASVHARVGALGLDGLDPYGLAGSRSAQWLQAVVSPGAPLGSAPSRWALAARQCDFLAQLLAAADRPQQLLADPRLVDALGVLAAQLAGPAAVAAALTAVPPAERAWLVDVVPGLTEASPRGLAPTDGPAPPPRSGRPPGFHLPWVGTPDIGALVHDVWQGLTDIAEGFGRGVADLAQAARALAREARGLQGAAAAARRQAARDTLAAARELRRTGARWGRLARLSRLPGWLRAATRPLGGGRVLRQVSRAAAGAALVGIVWDVTHGRSVGSAVVKAAVLLAVGVAVGAAVGAAVAAVLPGATVAAAVGAEIGLGFVAAVVASAVYDAVAPTVGSWLTGLRRAAYRAVTAAAGRLGQAARGAERALRREAARVRGLLGHLGQLGPVVDVRHALAGGSPAHAFPGALGRQGPATGAPLLRSAAAAAAAAVAAAGWPTAAGRSGSVGGRAGPGRFEAGRPGPSVRNDSDRRPGRAAGRPGRAGPAGVPA